MFLFLDNKKVEDICLNLVDNIIHLYSVYTTYVHKFYLPIPS